MNFFLGSSHDAVRSKRLKLVREYLRILNKSCSPHSAFLASFLLPVAHNAAQRGIQPIEWKTRAQEGRSGEQSWELLARLNYTLHSVE
jgi:hypothetical protein